MGRPSALTEKQWAEIQTRLLAGEAGRVLAREFGISEAAIRKRLSAHCAQIKTVANQIVAAETTFKALPVSTQIAVRNFADDLHAMNMHMAGAGKFNSATAHRLAGIANGQVDKIDSVNPMESQEVLQGIAAMLKLSNEAAVIPIGLMKANADQMRASQVDKDTTPKELPASVDDFV